MDLNLRLLRYFVTVADEGHFGRAAAKLFITPPALTQQIRRLEHEVGFSLLDRARHPVTPTPSGEAFLREVRAVLDAAQRAEAVARSGSRQAGGRFDLGFWTPIVFGDGDHFVCGSSILLHGKWAGLLMHSDASGTVKVCTDHFARANGPLVPGQYDKGTVLGISQEGSVDRFEFDARLTVPVHYDSLASGGKLMTDLYSVVS